MKTVCLQGGLKKSLGCVRVTKDLMKKFFEIQSECARWWILYTRPLWVVLLVVTQRDSESDWLNLFYARRNGFYNINIQALDLPF